jgi:hypothetical protein
MRFEGKLTEQLTDIMVDVNNLLASLSELIIRNHIQLKIFENFYLT